MAVTPGEVLVFGKSAGAAQGLLAIARSMGIPASHIRTVDYGYMVPAEVRSAYENQNDERPHRGGRLQTVRKEVDF